MTDKLPQSAKVVPLANARDRLFRRFPKVLDGLKLSGKGLSVKVFLPGEDLPVPNMFIE